MKLTKLLSLMKLLQTLDSRAITTDNTLTLTSTMVVLTIIQVTLQQMMHTTNLHQFQTEMVEQKQWDLLV
jgi:hypothetical protein